MKCVNCGADIGEDFSICPYCGTRVQIINEIKRDGQSISASHESSVSHETNGFERDFTRNPEKRRQEYAGYILKCPNCGAKVSQTTAICPECGHHITGQAAVFSVQEFSRELMALEKNRKAPGIGQLLGFAADPVDLQKLTLIRSFPIPNTIADIQEFMLLAIANIDDSLSRNTEKKRMQSDLKAAETIFTIPRTISDAWVAKMEQAYQKAAFSFHDDPAYCIIERLYFEKMKDLDIPVDD